MGSPNQPAFPSVPTPIPTSTPSPSPAPGPLPLALQASAISVPVGSVAVVPLPSPLVSLTALRGQSSSLGPSLTASLTAGQLSLAAASTATPGTGVVTVAVQGCTSASACGIDASISVPVTAVPIAAPPGDVNDFTSPSPDRIAAATPLGSSGAQLNDELILVLGTDAQPGDRAAADAAAASVGAVVSGGVESEGVYEIRWPTAQNLSAKVTQLAAIPGVEDVTYSDVNNAGIEDVTPSGWTGADPSLTWPYLQINAPAAWQNNTGSNIKVGIVDEGLVDPTNQLSLNVIDSISTDHALIADHATEVAGHACAADMGSGIVGMAWGCPIISAASAGQVIDGGQPLSTWKGVFRAAAKVAQAGARVINISLGINSYAPDPSDLSGQRLLEVCAAGLHEQDVLNDRRDMSDAFARLFSRYPNILWTVAAGNSCIPYVPSPMGVAAAGMKNVITVAATNSDGRLASFSDFGPEVDVAAPGGGYIDPNGQSDNGSYSTSYDETNHLSGFDMGMGTSFSAPMVAGVGALVATAHPDYDGAQIARCITSTAGTGGMGTVTARDDALPNTYTPKEPFTGSIPIVNAAGAVQCPNGGVTSTGSSESIPAGTADLSLDYQGHQVTGTTTSARISRDGRFAWFSFSSDLVPSRMPQHDAVYVRDTTLGPSGITRIDLPGSAGQSETVEAISPDGRYAIINDNYADNYVVDRSTGSFALLPTQGPDFYKGIANDGQTILAQYGLTGVYNTVTKQMVPLTCPDGSSPQDSDGDIVLDNDRFAAITSDACPNYQMSGYVLDLSNLHLTRVLRASCNNLGNSCFDRVVVSPDGVHSLTGICCQYVGSGQFDTGVEYDGRLTPFPLSPSGSYGSCGIDASGTHAIFDLGGIYDYDATTNTVQSVPGTQPNSSAGSYWCGFQDVTDSGQVMYTDPGGQALLSPAPPADAPAS